MKQRLIHSRVAGSVVAIVLSVVMLAPATALALRGSDSNSPHMDDDSTPMVTSTSTPRPEPTSSKTREELHDQAEQRVEDIKSTAKTRLQELKADVEERSQEIRTKACDARRDNVTTRLSNYITFANEHKQLFYIAI